MKFSRTLWMSVTGLALTAALSLGGTATSASAANSQLVFAGLGKSAVWYWFDVGHGMKSAGATVGAKVLFQDPQTADPAEQVNILNGYIAQNVSGIAFAASDPAAVKPAVHKALAAGIPVVMFDSDAPGSGRLMYVGANAEAGGYLAGREMVKVLHGSGTVAIQVGSLTALNAKQRIQGFMRGIKGSQIKVVTTQNDNENPSTAATQAHEILAAHPHLSAFMGVYAYDAAAEAKAVITAHRAGKTKIVGWDNEPDTIAYLKKGIISATVYDDEQLYGQVAVQILYDMRVFGVTNTLRMFGFHANGPRANNVVYTPIIMVTPKNVTQVFK